MLGNYIFKVLRLPNNLVSYLNIESEGYLNLENDHHRSRDDIQAAANQDCQGEPEFENSVVQNLVSSIHRFHRQEWEIHKDMEYTPGEIRVLMSLGSSESQANPGLKVSEISGRMRVTSPTITQFVKGLEKKELVERVTDEKDRRAVRVCLTVKGRQVVEEVQASIADYINGLVDFLGEEDSRKLAELLDKASLYRSRTYKLKQAQDMEQGR